MSPNNYWTELGQRRQTRRTLLKGGAIAGTGLAAWALAGCGDDDDTPKEIGGQPNESSQPTAAPVRGGTLQFANWSTVFWSDFVDPVSIVQHAASWNANRLYAEYLVDFDEKGGIQPALAEKWSYDSTGTELTLTLVDGAMFQDGTRVDAESVKYTIDRLYTKEGRPPGLERNFPSIPKPGVTVVDPRTVVLKLQKPYPDFLAALAGTSYFCLVSPTAYKTADDPWGWRSAIFEHPVTAGAFKLTDWQKGQSRRFERYDKYYKGGVNLDAFVDRFVADGSQRATLVRTGEAQLTTYLNPQDLASLKSNSSLNVFEVEANRVTALTPNFLGILGPDNAKTRTWRQALLMAIDRKTIVDTVLLGLGSVADSPMRPQQEGYKSTKLWPYDPKQAQKLLRDNGWDFNRTLTIYQAGSGYTGEQATCEAIQAMWSQIGLKAKLELFEYNAMIAKIIQVQDSSWDLVSGGWTMVPNIAERMHQLFNSKGSTNSKALANYVDADGRMDRLTEELLVTVDPNRRLQLLVDIQALVMDDLPHLDLFITKSILASSKKLSGLRPTIFESMDARFGWLAS